ncbi:poly [ADP-ribose] polymerase tankyrase-2-like [Mercenaria mercenaria]|uniref:poly [ADP-ribose] polymerase tankyrase-2-like n=1 Tax=Mercenaria mercenaria TaxID=6596 RepID=UPI00234F6FA1|nr:poly [ADP-ribose] polymerase tankyrase-2-like [Mercenaria mercenaria]
MSGVIPPPPPVPPLPKPYSLPPELLEDDEFTEKRYQKELQFLMVGAIERGDTRHLQELIDKGVNTNATIILVKTPLTQALEQNEVSYSIIETLLKAKGTDPNLADFTPWGLRPLHIVAKVGQVDLAKLFLEGCKKSDCDINAADKGGATPLHFAARYGHVDMVKYLLENSADMLTADDCGRTVLHRACEFQHRDVAQILIDKGIDVNITDNYGWTPLFHSIFFSSNLMAQFLIENGARADLHDLYGKTLLELACYNNIAPLHEGHLPEKVALATSFNFYERSKSIPSEEFLDLIYDLEQRFFLEDHECFSCVKMLINAGADPKEYPSDEMACNTFGVEAKIRAYLILAGAMLDPRDIWVTGTFPNYPDWRAKWFKHQVCEQISLFRQCRYKIRQCLAHTRNIDLTIESLPIPKGLREKLKLDNDFEGFMQIVKEGSK